MKVIVTTIMLVMTSLSAYAGNSRGTSVVLMENPIEEIYFFISHESDAGDEWDRISGKINLQGWFVEISMNGKTFWDKSKPPLAGLPTPKRGFFRNFHLSVNGLTAEQGWNGDGHIHKDVVYPSEVVEVILNIGRKQVWIPARGEPGAVLLIENEPVGYWDEFKEAFGAWVDLSKSTSLYKEFVVVATDGAVIDKGVVNDFYEIIAPVGTGSSQVSVQISNGVIYDNGPANIVGSFTIDGSVPDINGNEIPGKCFVTHFKNGGGHISVSGNYEKIEFFHLVNGKLESFDAHWRVDDYWKYFHFPQDDRMIYVEVTGPKGSFKINMIHYERPGGGKG